MKVTKFKEELKKLSTQQLQEKVDELRRELFSLRLSTQTAHVQNYAKFKQLRKDIARVMTFVNQKDKSIVAEK
jgi:large subunit ribosomal protein L29